MIFYNIDGDIMKRVIYCFFMTITIILILIASKYVNNKNVEEEKSIKETRSIFVSYIELSKYLNDKDSVTAKKNIEQIVLNVKEFGFNEIILQVRSFSDAIYPSKIFPWSSVFTDIEGVDPGYDALKYFREITSREKISLIAWINPYRVRNDTEIGKISVDNPAYKYLGTDIVYINNGIYYNPSKDVVKEMIVEGVREIIDNYKVDGILFDDYFYPDNNIDLEDYYKYLDNNSYISKEEYNLTMVNDLIERVYRICHSKKIKFGISPDGNMENNYNKVFADVRKWTSDNKYIDFIMPQVYYGFYNEVKPFKKTIDEWESIIKNEDIELYLALAFYKNGKEDKYAKSGKDEWLQNNDIIMRQIISSRNLNKYRGFALFRYDYIFDNKNYTDMTVREIENIKKVLN